MRKIILFGVLVIALFLVSCAPTEQVSDEEIEADLADLSDEELLDVATAEDSAALAGQASKLGKSKFTSKHKLTAKDMLIASLGADLIVMYEDGTPINPGTDPLATEGCTKIRICYPTRPPQCDVFCV